VHLVEINHVDGKATEAVFEFAADRIGAQDFLYLALGIPAQAAFGEDVGPRAAPAFEGEGNNFLRVSEAVDGGGIDPLDAEFKGAVNGGDRIVVAL
jgi:hypothetical protein